MTNGLRLCVLAAGQDSSDEVVGPPEHEGGHAAIHHRAAGEWRCDDDFALDQRAAAGFTDCNGPRITNLIDHEHASLFTLPSISFQRATSSSWLLPCKTKVARSTRLAIGTTVSTGVCQPMTSSSGLVCGCTCWPSHRLATGVLISSKWLLALATNCLVSLV